MLARDLVLANDRSHEQKPAATRLIVAENDPVPTVLGLLECGKSPSDWLGGACTQFLRIAGTDLTDPAGDEEVIHGTVADQIRRPEEKREAHNRRRVRFARAEALRALGYVPRFGAGIAIARKHLGARLSFQVPPGVIRPMSC